MAPKKAETDPKSYTPLVRRTSPTISLPAPASLYLSQRSLFESVDTQLTNGVPDMHHRTSYILKHTCHPPTSPLPLYVPPIFQHMPLITIAASSTTMYALDVDSVYDPLR